MIGQQHVEWEREGNQEEEEDWEELEESDEDVSKHHHVDSKARELPDKQHKFQPG